MEKSYCATPGADHPCVVLGTDKKVIMIAVNQQVAHDMAFRMSAEGVDVYGYRYAEAEGLRDMLKKVEVEEDV